MSEFRLLQLRVRGIKDGAARARFAFFIMLFSCGAIIFTLYNNYFAWNRIRLSPTEGLTEWKARTSAAEPAAPPAPAGAMARQRRLGDRPGAQERRGVGVGAR